MAQGPPLQRTTDPEAGGGFLYDSEAVAISEVIHDGDTRSVNVRGTDHPVFLRGECRTVVVSPFLGGFTLMQQNPKKPTAWGRKAREGHQLTWVMPPEHRSASSSSSSSKRWGLVEDGRIVKRCPNLVVDLNPEEEAALAKFEHSAMAPDAFAAAPLGKRSSEEGVVCAGGPSVTHFEVAGEGAPLCRFGDRCYRKNPQHFAEFRHPPCVLRKLMTEGVLGNPAANITPVSYSPPQAPPRSLQRTADDWKTSLGDIVMGERLGAGAFGEVRRALWRGIDVAVKVMHEQGNEDAEKMFVHEAELMCKLRHPNIVECLAACTESPNLCLVLEFMPGGTLQKLLRDRYPLSPDLLLSLARGIVSGLVYMHDNAPPVIHRDIKPENVLLDSSRRLPKLADFGVSREKAETAASMTRIGTPIFCAPEMIRGGHYSEKVDVYSYGMLLFFMATGKKPFEGTDLNQFQIMVKVATEGVRPALPDPCGPSGFSNLIRCCWEQDASLRPSARGAMDLLSCVTRDFDLSSATTVVAMTSTTM